MATKTYRLPTNHENKKNTSDSNAQNQHNLQTVVSHNSFSKQPFQIPREKFWLELWRVEKEKMRRQRIEERIKPVHEQNTSSSRRVSRVHALRNMFKEDENRENKANNVGEYSKRVLSETLKVRPVEREFTYEYIQSKKDMFLLEYSLQNKREEIARYKQKSKDEEQRVKIAAQRLYEDAILFDDFLKATDDAAVEAMQLAEKEGRAKMEKVAEFKKLQVLLSGLNTKISNMDEQLAEYYRYKNFLVLVYENYINKQQQPLLYEEWQKQREAKVMEIFQKRCLLRLEQRAKRNQVNERRKSVLGFNSRRSTRQSTTNSTPNYVQAHIDSLPLSQQLFPEEWEEEFVQDLTSAKMGSHHGKNKKNVPKIEVVSPPVGDKPAWVPFEDVKKFREIITELEEMNLALIYRQQQSEESLDDLKSTKKRHTVKMNKEICIIKAHAYRIKCILKHTEERAKNYEFMCNILQQSSKKDSNKVLAELTSRVSNVYQKIAPRPVGMDGLAMLTYIETRLEELLDKIEKMPPEIVEEAQRALDKKRRMQIREERLLEQKRKQEERARRAQERSQAETFKQTGRKLMFRSQNQQLTNEGRQVEKTKSTDSFDYFQ